MDAACSDEELRKSIWLYDSKGIISTARTDSLAEHKKPFAHEIPGGSVSGSDLLSAVNIIRPTMLVGVSAQDGVFTYIIARKWAPLIEPDVQSGLHGGAGLRVDGRTLRVLQWELLRSPDRETF
jgi:hypothetical protein